MAERAGPAPRRFRRRLTTAFILVGALVAGLVATTSFLVIREYRHRTFERHAVAQARLGWLSAPDKLSLTGFEDLLDEYRRRAGFETVAVADGVVYSSSPGLDAGDVPAELRRPAEGGTLPHRRTEVDGVPYLVVSAGNKTVRLHFFFSRLGLNQSLDRIAKILGVSWFLAVTVAALSGRLMARWTLRPVAQAAKAARDLSGRLLGAAPAPAGDDEVDSLTLSLSQLAEALEAKIDSLQAAAARERRFTSDVAHELRTPLTALRSAATLLEDELGALPARGRRPAQLMVDGVRRLESLVDELLQLARLDAGHEAVELEPLALGPALEAASGSGNGDGRVEIDVEGELCVLADRARLRRVVANLVTNARRHGGGDPLVRARRAGSWVVVDVVDQGPGIGEQHLGRIFDRFYKADTARSAGGSGLGLAIARENARLQGGTLEARNRDGGGACFTLRLPVAEVAPTTPPQDRGEPRRS